MSSSTEELLESVVVALRARSSLPKTVEFSQLGRVHMASAFSEVDSPLISEKITAGMDLDPKLALLKSLVELVERKAFLNGRLSNDPLCATPRSDGFAGFPVSAPNAKSRARENAFSEAIERFVWATWWDEVNFAHEVRAVEFRKLLGSASLAEELLRELDQLVAVRECIEVTPFITEGKSRVVLLFAFIETVGVVSGGACGSETEIETVRFRAVCELVRHALAMHRAAKHSVPASSFYEKRLLFFGATKEGEALVRMRLQVRGGERIQLPSLQIDGAVAHDFSDVVHIHRCYFENQPPFVGGKLERLCL